MRASSPPIQAEPRYQSAAAAAEFAPLRTCRLPLQSPVLLACSKCQKRLKPDGDAQSLIPLKKLLKRIAKRHGLQHPTILKVPCLKLCPGNGLVVLTPQQLAEHRCTILRTREDVETIYALLSAPKKKRRNP